MIDISETLQMIFRNEEQRNSTISLTDPVPELTAQEVEDVMNEIVGRNVFRTAGGELEALVRAQVVSRTVDVLREF